MIAGTYIKCSKKIWLITLLSFCFMMWCGAQENLNRFEVIKENLDSLAVKIPAFNDKIDTDLALNSINLSNFLLGISSVHKVNINVDSELSKININNNFSDVTIIEVLVFLCKEFSLTIEFTDTIISIKPFREEVEDQTYPFQVVYMPSTDKLSLDLKENNLFKVFKAIMDESAKNLVFDPKIENLLLTSYIKEVNFDSALEKLALSNNLRLTISDDGFYIFDQFIQDQNEQSTFRSNAGRNLSFKILDVQNKILEVDFNNTPIKSIVEGIAASLELNFFIASPLDQAGRITLKTSNISFDELLIKIFEPQNTLSGQQLNKTSNGDNGSTVPSQEFTFKKENGIYYFGTKQQLSVRKVEIITLKHRSVGDLTSNEAYSQSTEMRENFRTAQQTFTSQLNPGFNNSNVQPPPNRNYSGNNSSGRMVQEQPQTILDLIPKQVMGSLSCKLDVELNSLYVTGTGAEIEYLKSFLASIDKAIPVILIEVMIVEAQTNNNTEFGVEWGLATEPKPTQGNLYPTTDLTIGAQTINKIINGFSTVSVFNFGQVVPNFFATVKAMEANGNLKIKSTPKLATLNGHRASFSNGQTSYYAVVQRNIIGTDNPQTSEIKNYFPIDAKLGLDIEPFVTGDKQVILNINVLQSSFGNRIDEDAPPDVNSRNFSSVVRMKDQDIAVLGGLEEIFSSKKASGVPFLARVPVIQWLFSKQVREGRKSKLTVFIKPTIIY
jgi:type IV pilus assembly protein PilQ